MSKYTKTKLCVFTSILSIIIHGNAYSTEFISEKYINYTKLFSLKSNDHLFQSSFYSSPTKSEIRETAFFSMRWDSAPKTIKKPYFSKPFQLDDFSISSLGLGYQFNYIPEPILKPLRTSLPVKQKKTGRQTIFGATPIKFGKINSSKRILQYLKTNKKTTQDNIVCGSTPCDNQYTMFTQSLDDKSVSFLEKINRVNKFVNRKIEYKSDQDGYGTIDKWSLPAETMHNSFGDCEDFAILKMHLLAQAGIPMKAMSIVILKDTSRQLYHAVLSVKTNVGYYILDNVTNDVKIDKEIANYFPLYSVGAAGNHIYGFKSAHKKVAYQNISIEAVAPGADVH
ncbi:MAG: transglutaminase-like cysteine peptidase [Hyphomicrobiales bacterium]